MPAECTQRRAYTFKASLSASSRRAAETQLARLAELYNAALEERREAWRRQRVSVTAAMQSRQLPDLKVLRPEYAAIDAQVLQDCLQRLDRAFRAFFRRVQAGATPGYPRFKAARRYDSLTFKQTGWKREGRHLTLRGIGRLRLFVSREIEGRVKTVTLRRDACGDWWVTFSCDQVPRAPLPAVDTAVGIDLGLEAFLTTSDGARVPNPRIGRREAARIARLQRRVSRRRKGGTRRRKAVRTLARAQRRVQRVRAHHGHQVALALVRQYGVLAVEDLNIQGMSRSALARAVHDAGWGQFLRILRDKAASAGRCVVRVNPSGTSQDCSQCGARPVASKSLGERQHACPCGYVAHRDVNAARNILARGLAARVAHAQQHTAGTPPSGSRPASKAAASI